MTELENLELKLGIKIHFILRQHMDLSEKITQSFCEGATTLGTGALSTMILPRTTTTKQPSKLPRAGTVRRKRAE